MKFHELAVQFFSLSRESSRLVITQKLAELLRQVAPEEARIIAYLSLGMLRAPYQNNQFNFAQRNVEKVLADVLAQPLPAIQTAVKAAGELGQMVLDADWLYDDEDQSVIEIYQRLSAFQEIAGMGAQEQKATVLAQLLKTSDALCVAMICKIVIGTMRLGFSDMTFIDALSWLITDDKSLRVPIEAAYNLSADLGLIAYTLKRSGIDGLCLIKPTLGIPIRPAAAERAVSAQAVLDKIGPCVAQPKLDGFRLQIHLDKTASEARLWFFSRNLQDMSNMFPDLTEEIERLPITSAILEGEALAYNAQTETYLPFQVTVKRKRKHAILATAEELPLHLFIFNILFLDGSIVLEKTQRERRKLLSSMFKSYSSPAVHLIDEISITSAEELNDYLNVSIDQGLEGIVAKRPDAPYQAGKRNFNWIKLKRVESGHLSDTIDAVILGYYLGRGRRAPFGIGAYLAGIYNAETDQFETVAKVGTGLTDDGWRELKSRADAWVLVDQPSNVVCPPELVPDVWVEPALVTVILADEITQSPVHTAGKINGELGLALRFPRFVHYADDKTAEQATTVAELRELFKAQFSAK